MTGALKSGKRSIDGGQVLLMVLATGACLGLAVLGGILAIFTPLAWGAVAMTLLRFVPT